jgi:hypothetical protein
VTTANLSPLLITTAAGRMMGIHGGTVPRWIAKGIIPADCVVWSGNRARIRQSWITSQVRGGR